MVNFFYLTFLCASVRRVCGERLEKVDPEEKKNIILDKRRRIKWVTVGGGVDEEGASPEIVAQVYPRVIEALKQ